MGKLPIPPVPDLARAQGETRDEVISWFVRHYNSTGAPFNYLSSTRSLMSAYKGLHNLAQLKAGCTSEKTDQGKRSNTEVVEHAAPLAFGRSTQVFTLDRRSFNFGRDFNSPYRVPFFFLENGVVKIYYIQPRKNYVLTFDQMCMVATIHKRFLLDQEFFGERVGVEYVDVSAIPGTKERILHRYALDDLPLWPEKRLVDKLTVISEALDYIQAHDLVKPRKRRSTYSSPDMPLF